MFTPDSTSEAAIESLSESAQSFAFLETFHKLILNLFASCVVR
jgi:hypothetical protein